MSLPSLLRLSPTRMLRTIAEPVTPTRAKRRSQEGALKVVALAQQAQTGQTPGHGRYPASLLVPRRTQLVLDPPAVEPGRPTG
jgi:hypothetical protein